jgi:peptide-methionine (S)-S-oxide reductase
VQITFDPKTVSFGKLLQIYFSVAHDPTELNYQGPDQGTSYRSEIFAASPDQQKTAEAYVAQLGAAHIFSAPIVTKIEPLKGFYPAEGYHQDFLVHNPSQPYIVYNDLPKIAALKRVWPEYFRDQPVLLASR